MRYARRAGVAATAAEVATMPLPMTATRSCESGDTDPDNESRTSFTKNRLLDNADGVLAHASIPDLRMRQNTDASHELRTSLAAIQGYAELTMSG